MTDDLLEQLKKYKFDKQLKKIKSKLKNKTIIIYGTGLLFQKIVENYDLSDLNIIGVSDRKYTLEEEGSSSFGYKVIPIDKIVQYKPDVVLIATLKFLSIMDDLKRNTLKGLEVSVLPLVDRPFFTLLKEIFQ